MADTPTPRPLTADEAADLRDAHACLSCPQCVVLRLVATVEQLQAEVDRLTADLATTTNLLHNLFDRYDLGADGEPAERYEARAAQPQEPT